MHVQIDSYLQQVHPDIRVEYVVLRDVSVGKSPPRLKKLLGRLEEHVRSGNLDAPLLPSHDSNLDSWARFSQLMHKDAALPAPADLLLTIRAGRSAPRISNVVDIANTTAISTGLPVGAFDLDEIDGNPILRRSIEGERYVGLFETEPTEIPAGEIVYADNRGVFSRYAKDAHRTRITETTRNVLLVVDACAGIQDADLKEASTALLDLIRDVMPECGAEPPRRASS